MNKDEAERILKILLQADGGCVYCVSNLCKKFIKKFPEYSNLTNEFFEKEFEQKINEKIKWKQ